MDKIKCKFVIVHDAGKTYGGLGGKLLAPLCFSPEGRAAASIGSEGGRAGWTWWRGEKYVLEVKFQAGFE